MKRKEAHTGKPFISLERVTIEAHGRRLFKDLSWKILDTEHWAIVGPNASGKSTLMKALAGTHGVHGKITYHFWEKREEGSPHEHIAYVSFDSQRQALGPESFLQDRWNIGLGEEAPTVSDILSEKAIAHDNPFIVMKHVADPTFKKRRGQVIRMLGVQPLLTRKMMQLSNGERRKIGIARALLRHPKLLILDNPFEGLDEQFRVTFRKTLEKLMRGNTRIIVATRDEGEIPLGITNVLRISERGTVSKTKRHGSRTRAKKPGLKDVRVRTSSANGRPILVQMRNVNVSYNNVPVLRKIDWTVRERERWALLGQNGAGKTTLLSLILGDNPQAYANEIALFGKRRGSGESIWEIKKNIGWVAPELQLYYPLGTTCLDVVCSGWFDTIGLYRECSIDQREIALAWLQRFGLLKKAATTFADLSEGEERLALLARALVKNPALLVLDEPCQGLDAAHRTRVLKAIDWVAKQHATAMIYVTHRADELPKSITHVFRLAAGKRVGNGKNTPE